MCNYLSCPKDLLLSAQILIAVSPLVFVLCDKKVHFLLNFVQNVSLKSEVPYISCQPGLN